MFGIDDAALALVLGGLISTAGKLYTNKENISAEQKANEINWEIARLNNATEVEMANTAHQREIADLRAAGLNPILSAGGNGSSTPSLTTPTLNPVHTDSEMFDGLANSAKGLARYFGEEYKARLSTAQSTAQSALAQSEIDKLDADARSRDVELESDNRAVDIMKSRLEREELSKLTHLGRWRKDENGNYIAVNEWHPDPELKDAVRQGIISDAKLRANSNWRANLSSFVPFVSPAAVHQGASAVNSARAVKSRRTP